jgi:hypothetical protein
VQNEQVYKINDVEHIERLDEVDDINEINKAYKLSEIGLTHEQKQQIMNGKSVTTKNKLEIDGGQTIALTTDSGVYIVDVGTTYPDTLTVMTLVSFILFFCIFLFITIIVKYITDIDFKHEYGWLFIMLVATPGAIISELLLVSLLIP